MIKYIYNHYRTEDDMSGRMTEKSVSCLRGVGQARQDALSRMGIFTLGDLIRLYPRAYQNRGDTLTVRQIKEKLISGGSGIYSSVLTVAAEPTVRMIRRGMVLLKVRAFDETGTVEITYFNQQYLKDTLHTGLSFRFFGRFSALGKNVQLSSPITEAYSDEKPLDGIVPVYPLTDGIKQKFISSAVMDALRLCSGELTEYMPTDALTEMSLPSYSFTVNNIHHPESIAALESAKRRLVFDELYLMYLSMMRTGAEQKKKNTCVINNPDMRPFLSALPFEMTRAQKRSLGEILADMSGDRLMNRIVTGDVGSGKTAVAEGAAYAVVKAGYRVCVMVPTEILANQHFEDFSALFEPMGIHCALLTGSTKKREREAILSGLDDSSVFGEVDILIGTHAILSDGVNISRLGLAIIDEQHRFGVMQRAALFEKAENVHSLVMSATPIPRTLTLAAYGSIDVSRIDELPAGRQKIDTFVVNESYRARLNGFIRKQVTEGHQVYVVCPAVEEVEKQTDDTDEMADLPLISPFSDTSVPLKSAKKFADYLADEMPELRIGFVHGKLKSAEKDRVMAEFASGNIDVLVSTTVIEVGVNVPNATLMIVENAERFGLAQLHQLRGRVGRGSAKSYFILVSDSRQPEATERLNTIKTTRDGFEIAEYDLLMRGPGDFFGEGGTVRQHGQMSLRLASACRDISLIEKASFYAKRTLEADPTLSKPENARIKAMISDFDERTGKTAN